VPRFCTTVLGLRRILASVRVALDRGIVMVDSKYLGECEVAENSRAWCS
jgi:hypothetical protein